MGVFLLVFSINFNNKNSFDNMGLKITNRPNIPIAEKNLSEYVIEGRNGTLTEDLETYKNIEIPINFNFIERSDFFEKILNIKKWLLDIKDNRLLFSDSRYYYKVKYVKCNDIARSLKVIGRLTVIFVCEPFLYSCSKNTFTSQPAILKNSGLVSQPLIKAFGNGNILLNINDITLTIKDVSNYVIIDSDLQNCYDEFGLKNNKMFGDFPVLQEGENTIAWSSNVTKIEIEPNWRWL